jgi:leucyl-tRNA synthetase
MIIPIQVNGKLRGKIEVDVTASREQIEAAAREQVQEWVLGKQLRKVIYIENKLINFVV